MEPLAQQISEPIRAELQANTKALEQIQRQLTDLVEVQISFLERIQHRSER